MGKMMADKDILLGIDFGSGGCKVSAIDTVGTLVGEASVEYPTHYPHPGFSEQEPADWYARQSPSTGPRTTRCCWTGI